mmetsp:Transcript_35768/g.91137  ORF Transcript_35768/g.91137 Transcript_35768/m.91137 type:complete len:291 (+) Transcript_35768:29-901(+)
MGSFHKGACEAMGLEVESRRARGNTSKRACLSWLNSLKSQGVARASVHCAAPMPRVRWRTMQAASSQPAPPKPQTYSLELRAPALPLAARRTPTLLQAPSSSVVVLLLGVVPPLLLCQGLSPSLRGCCCPSMISPDATAAVFRLMSARTSSTPSSPQRQSRAKSVRVRMPSNVCFSSMTQRCCKPEERKWWNARTTGVLQLVTSGTEFTKRSNETKPVVAVGSDRRSASIVKSCVRDTRPTRRPSRSTMGYPANFVCTSTFMICSRGSKARRMTTSAVQMSWVVSDSRTR